MAHYSSLTAAALAVSILLGGGALQASAAGETETAAADSENGWKTENGKLYYTFADGSKAVGETEIDGIPYLFGYSGALKTDWQTVNGKRYYYDPMTGQPVYGWVDYFDSRYYVTPEDGKLTGMQEIDGGNYAFSEDGALLTDVFYYDDTQYYAAPESGMLQGGFMAVNDGTILTNAAGEILTGWQEVDGKRFYLDPETALAQYGLVCVDGVYYYITPTDGVLYGNALLEGTIYPLNAQTGALHFGWFENDGVKGYFDESTMTMLVDCIAEIDGVTYSFDENGALASGWRSVDGATYYFDENGIMVTGIVELMGSVFCFAEDGKLSYGWQTVDGAERYFKEDGTMAASETLRMDKMIYTFGEDGSILAQEEASAELDVVSYKQKDDRWANEALGKTSTIGKEGCLVTSLAMVQEYHTGETVTPVDMRDKLTFTSGGALSSWNDVTALGYTVEDLKGSITTSLMEHLYEKLLEGSPLVLGSKKSGGGQHYVVVTGYTGDGTSFDASQFLINDPGYTKRFTLSDHLAEYGTLYKLIY